MSIRRLALLPTLGLAFVVLGCGEHPEEAIVGCWTESEWRYERVDVPADRPDGPSVPRHEAERWELRPDGSLIISRRDGTTEQSRWRLKGRGHVMTLSSPQSGQLEVYEVKELGPNALVLHYEVGMEVRGIARLAFRRAPDARACLMPSDALASTAAPGGRS